MLLRSITLKNIRSYGDEVIHFPSGLTVFTGDVGSGKSTILYAVEFAFFGATSDLPMEYLLRHGQSKGSVELDFEIGGKEYTVHREIVKKDDKYSSRKKGNWIKHKGALVTYTPSEMKEQVLRTILQFNESLANRASSVIYRFAVFTPQEEMKRILEQNAEDRLKTLRRAFRVEDYKVAADNSKIISSDIRRQRLKLEGMGSHLLEKETHMANKDKERAEHEKTLGRLVKMMTGLEKDLENKKLRKEDLERLEKDKMNLERYHESTLKDVENLKSRIKRARDILMEMDEARARMEELEPKLKELDSVKTELGDLEEKRAAYSEKEKGVLSLEKDKEALEARVKELKEIIATAPEHRARAKDLEKSIDKAQRALEKVLENKEGLVKLEAGLDATKTNWGERFAERENYKELEGEARCPKCGQELTIEHLNKVLGDLETDMKALEKEEKGLKRDIALSKERIEKFTAQAKGLEEQKEELHKIQGELTRLSTEGAKLKELKQHASTLEVDLKAAKGTLKKMAIDEKAYEALRNQRTDLEKLAMLYVKARAKVEGAEKWRTDAMTAETELAKKEEKLGDIGRELDTLLEKYNDVDLARAKQEFENAKDAITDAEKQVIEVKTRLESVKEEIQQVSKEIDKKREYLSKAEENKRAEDFLQDCFNQVLDVIEKHVLASINVEFEEMFKKWFNMLIESPELNVRIDDNFTPIIEQDGYELDHRALSGGERTSVALGYRLALNAMVKRTSTTMKENLLILDEPTDGFSMEQLTRVREVLEELRSDQCIIVTHERELEGFADKVFHVVKEGGESRVND